VLGLLDPYGLVIDQHLDGLPPEDPIDIEAEVVQPNLPILAHSSGRTQLIFAGTDAGDSR
jgi:hypothetical protein